MSVTIGAHGMTHSEYQYSGPSKWVKIRGNSDAMDNVAVFVSNREQCLALASGFMAAAESYPHEAPTGVEAPLPEPIPAAEPAQ
jgi:hypothetical protein